MTLNLSLHVHRIVIIEFSIDWQLNLLRPIGKCQKIILLIRFMTVHIAFKLQTKIGLKNFYMLTTTLVVTETASVANLKSPI